MKKRWFSLLLALCMAMSLLPTSVIAEEVEASVCTCQSACTAESRDSDCPVCGAENATEADCALYTAPEAEPEEPETEPELSAAERVQALIDALPTAAEVAGMTEAERDAVYADAEEAYAAFESLESAEELAAVTGLEKLSALMEALTAPAETYAPSKLFLGNINVLENTKGDGYSYSNGVLTLTDYDNHNVHSSNWRALGNRNGYTTLYCNGDLTIKLVGTNRLTITEDKMQKHPTAAGTEEGKELYSGIFVDGALTIQTAEGKTEQGKLIVTAEHGAIQCATLKINNADLDLTAYRDCVYCSNADIYGGSKVKAVSSGDNMNYCAFRAAYTGTSLQVRGASTLTAETHGYGCTIHYSSGDRYEQPCGIDAEGKILVTENSVVIGKSLNSTAGKDNADCKGYGVRCGSLEIYGGGKLEGHSEGKNGKEASGADGVYVKGELKLQGSATVYGETNCNTFVNGYRTYGAIHVGSLPETMQSDGVEVSRCHITTPYLGQVIERDSEKYIGTQSEPRANKATIRGIMDCTLKLSENNENKLTYGYYDTSTGATYTDTLDLTQTNTVGTGNAAPVVTRKNDPLLIHGIVVEKGHHKIKIPDGFYAAIYDTYITVKKDATLDLYLTGSTVFWDRRTTGANAPIVVEPGGTLNILNGTGTTFASLSITSSVAPGIGSGNTDAGYGTVSVEKCILLVRGYTNSFALSGEPERIDIMTDLTIGDNAYVDANFGTTGAIPRLTMTGGTLVGRVGETLDGKTTIYYSGIGNLQLTNAEKIKVVDASNPSTQLCPVEVTLYDEYGLFDEQTYTASIRVLNDENTTELQEWRMRLVSSLTIARGGSLGSEALSDADVIPLHLTGDASEKQNCKLTLYLKENDLVTEAKIKAPATGSTVSYWTSAAKEQQIIAKKDTTAKGALYTVGHLLMNGVMSLRGAEPADSTKGVVLQVCPDSEATENPYWIDYGNMGYKTFKLNTPEGYSSVSGYTLRVESNEHKIILDGLTLRPDPDTSCVELVGVGPSSTSTKVLPPHLIVALLDGKTNILSNVNSPIFNMQSDSAAKAGNTLEFRGVTDGETSYDRAVGGKLTLEGGQAFGNTEQSDLIFDSAIVDNQCAYENDPNNSHTFRNLTFQNSTVIGMGKVKADSIIIDGGSVDITPIGDTTVKNSAGATLTRDTLTFPSGSGNAKVTELTLGGLGDNSFDTSNITTDSSGRINLWLPDGAYVISARVGGKLYYAMENENGGYDFVNGTAPSFITPAANKTLIINDNTTLSVKATGAPRPTLTWKVSTDGGNTWSEAVEGFDADGKFNMTPECNGWKLRCVATNTYVDEQGKTQTGTATSPVYTVYYLPVVNTAKLTDQTVAEGQQASFSVSMLYGTQENVVPTGLTAHYQWQRLVDLTKWENIENATDTTYTPTATAAMNGWQLRYRVTYTAADGTSKTVDSGDFMSVSGDDKRMMTLTVVDAPKITQQPKDAAVVRSVGMGSANFTIAVATPAVGTLSYQWQKKTKTGTEWENVSGFGSESSDVYYIRSVTANMDGDQFRCVVTNTYQGVTNTICSDVATLAVLSQPTINTWPDPSVTVRTGGSTTLEIKAEGNGIVTYQWKCRSHEGAEWRDITGATASTYTVTATAAMNGWQYRCEVTNSFGGVSLSTTQDQHKTTLTVVDAPSITKQPVDAATLPGGSATFTVTATGNQTLRYQWQSSSDGKSWSNIDGAIGASYTLTGATLAQNGTQYRCAVTNSANGVDNTAYSAAATLAVVGQPIITQQPKDDIAHLRGSAHFTVAATGNQTLRYQWQVSEDGANWSDITGATDADCTLNSLRLEMTGWQYRCVVTNFSGDVLQSVESEAATLTTIDPPGATEKGGSVTVTESEHGDSTIIRNGDDSTATVTPKPDKGYRVVEVIAEDEDGNQLEVRDNGDGRYIIDIPKGSKVTVKVIYAVDEDDSGFVDVPEGKYFYDAVNWAVANGVTGGVDATHFDPYASCTRGQLVTFLWRAAGQPAAKNANTFSDVAAGRYCEKAVAWAAENEIVGGYDDGTFRPDATVTRQQTAAILWRFAKYAGMDVSVGEDTNILSYSDALSISDYAFPAIQWAVGAEVMGGSGDKLLPRDTCTRAQIVTMLYRCLKK